MSWEDGHSDLSFSGAIKWGLITIFVLILLSVIPLVSYSVGYQVEYQSLYYTQAPFGILYADTSGSINGNFIWISGSISTSLGEAYVIKYWQNGELLSTTLPANQVPIVVDGTFRLETNYTINQHQPIINLFGLGKGSIYNSTDSPTYILHLPSLPVNATGYSGVVP